jgi:hypothetical protein
MPEFSLIVAVETNFSIYEGDKAGFYLEFLNTEDNTPQDLTLAEITMEIRSRYGEQGMAAVTLSTENGKITRNPGGRGLHWVLVKGLEAVKYADGVNGTFVYDVQRKAGGNITTEFYGKITVKQEVTQAT